MESGMKGDMENLLGSETENGIVDSVKERCNQHELIVVTIGGI